MIEAFNTLPKGQKLFVAKAIQIRMADDLFEKLEAELPDTDISTVEIQQEIKAYRDSQKKKNLSNF